MILCLSSAWTRTQGLRRSQLLFCTQLEMVKSVSSMVLRSISQHVFGEWQKAEVRLSPFPQSQHPDPLTSFCWHGAVPSPLHTQDGEAGAAHKSQNVWKCASAPSACTDPIARLQTEPTHQLAHAKEAESPSGSCLPAPIQLSNPANCSLLSF